MTRLVTTRLVDVIIVIFNKTVALRCELKPEAEIMME